MNTFNLPIKIYKLFDDRKPWYKFRLGMSEIYVIIVHKCWILWSENGFSLMMYQHYTYLYNNKYVLATNLVLWNNKYDLSVIIIHYYAQLKHTTGLKFTYRK